MSFRDSRSKRPALPLCIAMLVSLSVLAPRAFSAEALKPDPKTPATKPKPLLWYSAYLQACAEARKADRLILAYFCSSDGDEWTTKLDKEVMNSPMFRDFAEKNLILLKLDFLKYKPNFAQKEQNDRLMRKYNVTKVPTLLFLDQDGLLIARCGYDTAALREEEEKGKPVEWIKHCEDVIKNRPPPEPIIEQKTLDECLTYAKKHYLPMLLLITKGEVPLIMKTKTELLKNQPFVKFINQNYAFCQIQWPADTDTSPSAKTFREFVEANKIGSGPMQLIVYDHFQPTTKVRARIFGITPQDIDPLIERLDKEVPNPDYSGQWLDDWRQAKFISNRLRRPLFICFTSMDSSEYCQKFEQEIFKTDEFIKYAKKNLVLLRVDFPKDEKLLAAQPQALKEQNKELADQFAVRGYPTVEILNFMGQRIGNAKYMKGGPEFFIKQLDQVVRNDKFSRP